MNRLTRVVFMLASAGLLVLLLALAVSAQVPHRTYADPIKVPDDYPTIQEAIDAAPEGAEIRVAEGTYRESLSITKSVTLSGGWNITFTHRIPGNSAISGLGLRRPISITCPTSDTLVTIDGFWVTFGNATGRGGPPEGLSAVKDRRLDAGAALAPDLLTPAERFARLQTELGGAVERGLYPGGSAAYRSTLDRVQKRIDRLEQAGSEPQASESQSQEDTDCGGGIYSWNASLHLLNSTIQNNFASKLRDGCGGGVYVGRSAPGGVLIRGNVLQSNIASTARNALGIGGGLYAYRTPGIVVEFNVFQENGAASAGEWGVGGGLAVEASPGAMILANSVVRNTASGGWEPSSGEGGGASLFHVIDATVTHNQFHENLASVHGQGVGGGLYVGESASVQLANNDVVDNWAIMFQMDTAAAGGGGFALYSTDRVTVTGNVFEDNVATVSGPQVGFARGGGLEGEKWNMGRIADNAFRRNVASLTHVGRGGGASLMAANDAEVVGNSFTENAAGPTSDGEGGGLYLVNTKGCRVRGNSFRDNLAAATGEGQGGGLCVAIEGPYTFDTTVDGNLFANNRADADPASSVPSYGGACSLISDGLAFTNNVMAGNDGDLGGGVALLRTQGGEVTNNTLVGNSNAGILVEMYNETPITITNNIVVSQAVGISVAQGVTATVDYTLWHGNIIDIDAAGLVTHTHPVVGSPAFVDPAAGDYRLTVASAARDAGDPAGVPPAPDHDIDGVARPQGPAVDLGAYEWEGTWLRFVQLFE